MFKFTKGVLTALAICNLAYDDRGGLICSDHRLGDHECHRLELR